MKKDLIIFGKGDIAELAKYYFIKESEYNLVAFINDKEYVDSDNYLDLPLYSLDDLPPALSPGKCEAFVALSYSKLNSIRRDKYYYLKSIGYSLASFISPNSTILNSPSIGDNCFILEDNTLQPFSYIGNNVYLWSGNHIGHHSIIRDHSFIASHVVISGGVEVGEQCFIGVNATLRDHILIGEKSIIGAGAIISADVAPEGVYMEKQTQRSIVPSHRLKKI